jgi:hypothetical protein
VVSTGVPDSINSSPIGAIANIPTRNCTKSTMTIIATIIKMIVQSVPSISLKNFIDDGLYRCTKICMNDFSVSNTLQN